MEVRKSILKAVYKKRKAWVRKHDFGNLLIVGGSKLYLSTPIISALAAYRAGVDWVTVAAPEDACKVIASYSPNIMVHPLEGSYIEKKHVDELLSLTKKRTAILIGGGLTRSEAVLEAVADFLEKADEPCIIDDDAIYAVARRKSVIKSNFILLPHSFEFYVLSGIKVTTSLKDRAKAVKEAASSLGAVILLKGHVDVISDGKHVAFNRTGTPLMTKAGFGNTLAGICAAIVARGVDCFTAACAAAYVNGRAGEIASKIFYEGMLPTDLIEFIPDAIKG